MLLIEEKVCINSEGEDGLGVFSIVKKQVDGRLHEKKEKSNFPKNLGKNPKTWKEIKKGNMQLKERN